LAVPDPQRLEWRDFIKQTLHDVLSQPTQKPLSLIQSKVTDTVPTKDRENVQALIIDELKRVHAGVLARYRITLSQFTQWAEIHRKEK